MLDEVWKQRKVWGWKTLICHAMGFLTLKHSYIWTVNSYVTFSLCNVRYRIFPLLWWRTYGIIGKWLSQSTYIICTDKETAIIGTDLLNIGIIYMDQQGSQCTYNVTLRRVRVTIVVVEK